MSQKTYAPYYHRAKPCGCSKVTIFASVELCDDDPPDKLVIGRHVYKRDVLQGEKKSKDNH